MASRRRLMAPRLAWWRRRVFRVAWKAVVRDRLPLGGVGDVLAVRGPDARVLVERAHADSGDLPRIRIDAPERRSAAEQNAFGNPSSGSKARIRSSPEVIRIEPGTI